MTISRESRRLAGILLVIIPTVVFGGASILRLLIGVESYTDNPMRQGLWGAGHAHAGVLLMLALVMLLYVDQATLSRPWLLVARYGVPLGAILVPAAFFLSVIPADATSPNGLINLAWVGAVSVAAGVLALGIGLLRAPAAVSDPSPAQMPTPVGTRST